MGQVLVFVGARQHETPLGVIGRNRGWLCVVRLANIAISSRGRYGLNLVDMQRKAVRPPGPFIRTYAACWFQYFDGDPRATAWQHIAPYTLVMKARKLPNL